MKYNQLSIKANKSTKRVGRGISAGQGKTAGRGTKGQKSRAGSSRKPGFEGGQNPFFQKLPKLRGFKSHKSLIETVYTSQLDDLTGVIDNAKLAEAGLISSQHTKVKLLFDKDLAKKQQVKLQAASEAAIKSLQKKGGSFDISKQIGRAKTEADKSSKR